MKSILCSRAVCGRKKRREIMAAEKSKLIPFSKELEAAIDADAKRCRRSFVRQVEVVLMTYYGIGDVEVSKAKLEMLGNLAPQSAKKMPLLKAGTEAKKKRA